MPNALERELQREAQIGILSGPTGPKQPKNMAQVPSALTSNIGAGQPVKPPSMTRPTGPTSGTLPIGGSAPDPIFDEPVSQPPSPGATGVTPPVPPASAGTPSASTVPLVTGAPPPGWDAGNWNNPNMRTVKYDAGRLLHGARRPSEVARIVASPEFQARFPGATFDGKDRINFAGAMSDGTSGVPVNWVDVLLAADREGDTSNGIAWMPVEDAPASSIGGAVANNPSAAIAGDNSSLGRIMAELNAASNDDMSPAEREAILQLLQTGI